MLQRSIPTSKHISRTKKQQGPKAKIGIFAIIENKNKTFEKD